METGAHKRTEKDRGRSEDQEREQRGKNENKPRRRDEMKDSVRERV